MPQQNALEYIRSGQTPFFRLPCADPHALKEVDAALIGVTRFVLFFADRALPRLLDNFADPAIGAVGAATLGAALIARWSFIALLASQHRWGSLVAVPVAGRTAMVVAMHYAGAAVIERQRDMGKSI